MEKRIIVTGLPKSGTQYMANLLGKLSLRSYHEMIFTHSSTDWPAAWRIDSTTMRQVESSWMTVPFLDQVDGNYIIWHQLRHPLKILQCLTSHLTLMEPSATADFIWQHVPDTRQGTIWERAVHFILEWTRKIEDHAHRLDYIRYRLEDLDSDQLHTALVLSGYLNISQANCAYWLVETPRNMNSCHHSADWITWRMLHDQVGPDLSIRLQRLAWSQGYRKHHEKVGPR